MNDRRLFPRISGAVALALHRDVLGKGAFELASIVAVEHPDMIFPATGGTRVSSDELRALTAGVREAATKLGFPDKAGQSAAAEFDHAAGSFLHRKMKISPGEASRDEIWSFLALVTLPDVTTWRFPDQNARRFLGGGRNVYQRLWWRGHALVDAGEVDPYHLLKLPEDALVGLMERPAISSNLPVARAIARAIAEVAGNRKLKDREEAWRDAYKRIRQRLPLVNLEALEQTELERQVNEICSSAVRAGLAT
jgi:hypothetical protein